MTAVAARAALAVIGGDDIEGRYAADTWHAHDLGVAAARGRATVSFTGISPPWLRHGVKEWSRQRLNCNYAFNTVAAAALAFRRFSAFLISRRPPVERAELIDRKVIEAYLAWLAPLPLADATKALSRVFLRCFLEENRRHRWVPVIPLDAVIYPDEISSRRTSLPRFVPEFVMAQLESDTNLARLGDHYRHLVMVITETGLRAGDACALGFGAMLNDSSGWPCLRFLAHKMRAEQQLPLSEIAVRAITDQQHLVADTYPQGSPWLFPARRHPSLPQSYDAFLAAFTRWQSLIGLHDETGRSVHVVPHQLRHSLDTRLINKGVPQHVIQRLLGHASAEMTAVYAHLHDTTLRAELERYWNSRVNIHGRLIGFDPKAPTADAEWLKHNLARAADSLPNGFCGRPPQQDCPHPNACLTCPDFQTTVQFLPTHHRQAAATQELIDAAETAGHQRLAANHRQVLTNLNNIISALEAIDADHPDGA